MSISMPTPSGGYGERGMTLIIATAFKEWYSLQLKAISLQRKKCIVLDLDNTLWGGVLGEDGLNQIAIS